MSMTEKDEEVWDVRTEHWQLSQVEVKEFQEQGQSADSCVHVMY
jgi:hypothetical protein